MYGGDKKSCRVYSLGAFCFEKLMLAMPMSRPDLTQGVPYLDSVTLPTQIKKVTRFECDKIYDLNCTVML